MKTLLHSFLAVYAIASFSVASAQSIAQIGFGTQAPLTNNSIYSPICRFSASSGNDCSRSNLLYTDTELSNAGITLGATINKIAFYKIGTGASTAGFTFEILMRNSTTTAPMSTATTWANILSTHTPVYATTSETIPATSGWIEFTLSTPFVYTGQNLEIAMSHNMTAISGNPSTGPFDWQYTNGFQNYVIGAVSSSPPATLSGTVTNYKVRPNIQISYSSPLPVKLVSFTGEKHGSVNKLLWETASGVNVAGFELQRSADGSNFSALGFTEVHKENLTIEVQRYAFDDTNPAGENYYRLKQLDRDGSFEFSKVIAIAGARNSQVEILSVYPNPVKDVLNMKLNAPYAQKALVVIADAMGRVVKQQSIQLPAGEYAIEISVSKLVQGNYSVRVRCAEGCQSSNHSFIKK